MEVFDFFNGSFLNFKLISLILHEIHCHRLVEGWGLKGTKEQKEQRMGNGEEGVWIIILEDLARASYSFNKKQEGTFKC